MNMAPVLHLIAFAALSALVRSAPTDIVERDDVRPYPPKPYCGVIEEQHSEAGQEWQCAITIPGGNGEFVLYSSQLCQIFVLT